MGPGLLPSLRLYFKGQEKQSQSLSLGPLQEPHSFLFCMRELELPAGCNQFTSGLWGQIEAPLVALALASSPYLQKVWYYHPSRSWSTVGPPLPRPPPGSDCTTPPATAWPLCCLLAVCCRPPASLGLGAQPCAVPLGPLWGAGTDGMSLRVTRNPAALFFCSCFRG